MKLKASSNKSFGIVFFNYYVNGRYIVTKGKLIKAYGAFRNYVYQ